MPMKVDKSRHKKFLVDVARKRHRDIRRIAEAKVIESVNFVTSLTGRMADPIRAGGAKRRKHPGNWADRTSNLVRAISHEVHAQGSTIVVTWGVIKRSGLSGDTLTDVVEYAEELDNLNGIAVLAGINKAVEKKVFDAIQIYFKRNPIISA